MRYRRLGTSDLEVSEIGLGSWMDLTDLSGLEQIRACTDAAFDAGINFFDTANAYGRGLAETAWGEVLGGRRRDSFALATKVFMPMSKDPADRGLSAAQITTQLDASLARLRTEYVDLYQAHRFDPDVPIEETIEGFQSVVASGKARHIGFSEWSVEQIEAGIAIAGPGLFVASQPQYSMLWQAPEREIFPLCAAHGISQIVWAPLAQGLLTGKYASGAAAPPGSRAATSRLVQSMRELVMNEATLAAVDRLRAVAAGAGLTLAQLALAWVLRRPEVAAAIAGASRPEHVRVNATASGIVLDAVTLAAIDDALGEAPVREPTPAPFARPGIRRRTDTSEVGYTLPRTAAVRWGDP